MKPKIITVKKLGDLGDGWYSHREEEAQRIAKQKGRDKIYVFKGGNPWIYCVREHELQEEA